MMEATNRGTRRILKDVAWEESTNEPYPGWLGSFTNPEVITDRVLEMDALQTELAVILRTWTITIMVSVRVKKVLLGVFEDGKTIP